MEFFYAGAGDHFAGPRFCILYIEKLNIRIKMNKI